MKAVINTFDKYQAFAKHSILACEHEWLDNPFTFLLPYNKERPHLKKLQPRVDIQPIRTPRSIRETVLTLLQKVGDEEWFFWMMDDNYFLDLDYELANYLYSSLETMPEADGISFIRARKLQNGQALSGVKLTREKLVFLERKDYSQIWLPQFLRGKVMKYLFRHLPSKIDEPKNMDDLKYKIGLPSEHNLYVTRNNYACIGESTHRGKITRNCMKSFARYNLEPPTHLPVSEERIIIGD